jgi:Fungal Zn(2)-Cys(6) binuclear cluster domain
MPQTSEAEQVRQDADLKSFSCLTCRQRKVKCDRRNPCSNCMRAARQCSFIPPVRGKPKRRKAPKEGLHAKLRRYEEMLKSYGAKIEPSDNDITSEVETMSEADVEMAEDDESRDISRNGPFAFDKAKTRLITKNGSSRYFDKYVCCCFKGRRGSC